MGSNITGIVQWYQLRALISKRNRVQIKSLFLLQIQTYPGTTTSLREVGYGAGGIYFCSSSRHTELMQYLLPVFVGPSSNTCPKCEPQRAHATSVRCMPLCLSSFSSTEPGSGVSNDGQ